MDLTPEPCHRCKGKFPPMHLFKVGKGWFCSGCFYSVTDGNRRVVDEPKYHNGGAP